MWLTRNLLLGKFGKMIGLALVWRSASVPKEQPLQALVALKFIFEPEFVVLVCKLEKIEKFGGGLHYGEWWRLGIVDDDRYPAFIVISATVSRFKFDRHRPLGSKRRNHSFFCSLVIIFINEVDHCVL